MIKVTGLYEACEELERERGISKDDIIEALKDSMVAAYKRHLRIKEATNIEAILVEETSEIGIFRTKVVVNEISDPDTEIPLDEAKEILIKLFKFFPKPFAGTTATPYSSNLSANSWPVRSVLETSTII